MESQTNKREFEIKNFSGSVPFIRNIIRTLTSLVKLTKEDRMQAGIFIGYDEGKGNAESETFGNSDEFQ